MSEPLLVETVEYLGGDDVVDWAVVGSAYAAERAAQRSVCNVPADGEEWPDDLREAVFRRVAHNLAMRAIPLAVQSTITDIGAATTRVGGNDPEVRRLEAPYRKRKLA